MSIILHLSKSLWKKAHTTYWVLVTVGRNSPSTISVYYPCPRVLFVCDSAYSSFIASSLCSLRLLINFSSASSISSRSSRSSSSSGFCSSSLFNPYASTAALYSSCSLMTISVLSAIAYSTVSSWLIEWASYCASSWFICILFLRLFRECSLWWAAFECKKFNSNY